MQAPTFKVASRTVAVFATVASADGRLVSDLPRSAFTILDNTKPQAITVFSNDIQPITVVMLLDRSGSMRANFTLVEKAAEHFVAAMLPTDKARIGSFANGVQVDPPDFTSDHDRLLRILRTDLQPDGPTPLWNAVDIGIRALAREQGRRVILVFTDGGDNPGNLRSDNSSMRDVLTRAEELDVMIYAIGLEGRSGPAGRGGVGSRVDKPDGGLLRIASATGGGYFELTSTDDLATTFSRVADELHHQYALGFTATVLDGKRHTLDVQVSGSGLTVRARKSYLAVDDAGPPPLTSRAASGEALEAALSAIGRATGSSRAIRTWIGQSRGDRGKTRVTFAWEPAPKIPGAAVEVDPAAQVSIVASGPSDAEYFKGPLPATPASGNRAPFSATFDVDPGPLQLQLSVRDSASRVMASETRPITAIDFAARPTTLGTPAIFRARTLPEYQRVKDDPDAIPAVTREFNRTDRLLVRVPAYGLDAGAAVVGMRLLNQSGYVTKELAATPMGSPSIQQAEVPVANLPPGTYVIQITVVGDGEMPSELVAFRLER